MLAGEVLVDGVGLVGTGEERDFDDHNLVENSGVSDMDLALLEKGFVSLAELQQQRAEIIIDEANRFLELVHHLPHLRVLVESKVYGVALPDLYSSQHTHTALGLGALSEKGKHCCPEYGGIAC